MALKFGARELLLRYFDAVLPSGTCYGRNWIGCLLIYMASCSKERIVDAAKFVAQNVGIQGIAVLWVEYESMPHKWPMGFPSHPHSEKCYHSWAKACLRFVNSPGAQTNATITTLENSHTRQVEVDKFTNLTTDEVARLMKSKQCSIQPFTRSLVLESQL